MTEQGVKMKSENARDFSLKGVFAVIGTLGLLTVVLIPAITHAKRMADLRMVGAKGKDIFVAITIAETMCEPSVRVCLWPRTQIDEKENHDEVKILYIEKAFSDSTSYFYELYDGEHLGQPEQWDPYVTGFDYSKLAGAGVPQMTGKLRPENNMWCVAGNFRDETDDLIPVLVTRNVDCSSFRIKTQGNPGTPLRWSQQYSTPFGTEGWVMVRKGGAVFHGTAKDSVTGVAYPRGAGERPTDGNASLTSLVYLTPDGIACPQ